MHDHLGNTRVVYTPVVGTTSIAYTLSAAIDYFPYGKELRSYYNGEEERYLTTHHERDGETGLDYRGARFYDSDNGRFLSLDPLAADYAALNPYNYVAGNPLFFVDTDGKKIEIAYKVDGKDYTIEYQVGMVYEGNNDFVRQTVEALNYVNPGDVNGIITALVDLDKTITIKETKGIGKEKFISATNTIVFNPQSGLELVNNDGTVSGGMQSPAIGLLHELGHGFVKFFKSKSERRELRKLIGDYETKEEQYVIDEIETPAAKILGEGTRTNHDGRTVKMKNSTSTELYKKAKNKKQENE